MSMTEIEKMHMEAVLDMACDALRYAIKQERVTKDYSDAWHAMSMRSTAKDRLVKQFYAQRG